jgi:uncharacterized protein (DUF924 family)
MSPDAIVKFWLDAGPKRWFAKSDAFDADLRLNFGGAHDLATRGGFAEWEETATGALGLILLTDQIPRNIYRNSAFAFATDSRAREVAKRAIARGFDQQFDTATRCFFYLPFEHSENAADQARAVALVETLGDAEYLKFSIIHRDIITRFGRFPHRNVVMGRESTEAEKAFLADGGFAG